MTVALEGALIGLVAGAGHVLAGADHLAVVSPLAASRKSGAWRTGFRWGVGHAGGVMVIGLAAALLREALPMEQVTAWSERAVGISLVAVGLWALTAVIRVLRSPDDDAGRHREALHGREGRAAFAVGLLHGTAGAGHVLGVLPALALPTRLGSIAYLLFFAAGTVAAMSAYATLMGYAGRRLSLSGRNAYAGLLAGCSALSVFVGVYWLGLVGP